MFRNAFRTGVASAVVQQVRPVCCAEDSSILAARLLSGKALLHGQRDRYCGRPFVFLKLVSGEVVDQAGIEVFTTGEVSPLVARASGNSASFVDFDNRISKVPPPGRKPR